MNKDSYEETINGEATYQTIAKELLKSGKCIIGWTDEGYDHRDIMFVWKPEQLNGNLQRGLRHCSLYVCIMDFSCMGFLIEYARNNRKENSYIREKLHLKDNSCDNKICDLVNGVIKYLDIFAKYMI